MTPGCKRGESYSGQKKPFPIKDKLESHVRNVHQPTTPESSNPFTAPSPSVISTNSLNSFREQFNGSNSVIVNQVLTDPSLLCCVDSSAVLDVGRLTSVSGFGRITGDYTLDGSTIVEGITNADGLVGVNEFSNVEGLGSLTIGDVFDGTINTDGLSGVNGFADREFSGISSVEGFNSVDRLSRISSFNVFNGSADERHSVDGFASDCFAGSPQVEGLINGGGLSGFNGADVFDALPATDELIGISSINEFTNPNGPAGLSSTGGFSGDDGLTGLSGVEVFTNTGDLSSLTGFDVIPSANELPIVAEPDVDGYNSNGIFAPQNEFGWFTDNSVYP
jgi:hypothetical protein